MTSQKRSLDIAKKIPSLQALQSNAWQSTIKNATENIDCHEFANANSRNDSNHFVIASERSERGNLLLVFVKKRVLVIRNDGLPRI